MRPSGVQGYQAGIRRHSACVRWTRRVQACQPFDARYTGEATRTAYYDDKTIINENLQTSSGSMRPV